MQARDCGSLQVHTAKPFVPLSGHLLAKYTQFHPSCHIPHILQLPSFWKELLTSGICRCCRWMAWPHAHTGTTKLSLGDIVDMQGTVPLGTTALPALGQGDQPSPTAFARGLEKGEFTP